MRFEYDDEKAAKNSERHGVEFEQAKEVFADRDMLRVPARREGERRFLAVGMIGGRVASVVYTMRGDTVRIISARWASERERRAYYGRR